MANHPQVVPDLRQLHRQIRVFRDRRLFRPLDDIPIIRRPMLPDVHIRAARKQTCLDVREQRDHITLRPGPKDHSIGRIDFLFYATLSYQFFGHDLSP